MEEKNQQNNIEHYERLYSNYSLKNILYWLNNLEGYLQFVTSHETSWNAIYKDGFKDRLRGKKVLEMGCGDCNNAAVMAALGAEVYANDIAPACGKIVQNLNANYDFPVAIKFIAGDFLKNELEGRQFDFIIGKAFLHHLTLPVEQQFLKETARLLKNDGEARFFEPAINSKLLDEIRWMIPVNNRPSKLNKTKFKKWKEEDPHPDRSFSSKHFEEAGLNFFYSCEITPIGAMDRFRRLIRNRKWNGSYTRWALKYETKLPYYLSNTFARSQLIVYSSPKF